MTSETHDSAEGQTPTGLPPLSVLAEARTVFGERFDLAERFVAALADTGISHGLIGPREAPRLWQRHVLNCAVAKDAIPLAEAGGTTRLIDVGSGAGLPGVALAVARPDLEVHLVEPLARRTAWLLSTVNALGLTNVEVHTARAEDLWGRLTAEYVCARAVSNLTQLASWCLPLLVPHGSLLALKGARAEAELLEHRSALTRLGVVDAAVEHYGGSRVEPTRVVRMRIGASVDRRLLKARGASSAGSARRRSDRSRRSRVTTTEPTSGAAGSS